MDRESAWQLVTEHVQDRGLQRHMLAVEAAMRWYAELLGQDVERWGVVGLIKLDLWEHTGNVITAMQRCAADLDLDGRLATMPAD